MTSGPTPPDEDDQSGSVPEPRFPDGEPPQGLSWLWEIDLQELLDAVSLEAGGGQEQPGGAGQHQDQDAVLDEVLEAIDAGRSQVLSPAALAGRAAAGMSPGPGLAALLAPVPAADLADYALPDAAFGYRRIASWAQARELDCIAQVAARAAARDPKLGVEADGRPAGISRSACAQVSLALTLTGVGASWWTDLAVTLSWRLAATGAALRTGKIDLARARLIAEATSLLNDDAARAVEKEILPGAAGKTTGGLRAALRRAVIAADPDGAERRRGEAERRARVVLYPEEETTATLAGQSLPGAHAAAAMARIKAMARALKASGAPGSLDLLCAQVFIGMLLGTLPPIQPAEDAPPDEPPGDQPPGGSVPSGGSVPRGGSVPPGGSPDGQDNDDACGRSGHDDRSCEQADEDCGDDDRGRDDVPWPDTPAFGDDDDAAWLNEAAASDDDPADEDTDDWAQACPGPTWPDLPASVPPAPGAPRASGIGPASGVQRLLELSVPWTTLAGISPQPGSLSRLGPITPAQARQLADLASRDPATEWRVILTNPAGQARAVARIPRQRAGPAQPEGPQATGAGLISRVTLTIPQNLLGPDPPGAPGPAGGETGGEPGRQAAGVLAAALRAAAKAAARADDAEAADAQSGGCAHTAATMVYRPSPSLRDFVAARDLTCRYLTCRSPACSGDLDHTIPYDEGGVTCRCNLGGLCRTHHQIKQHEGWTLRQPRAGIFEWTTPAGHRYVAAPDIYPT